MSGLEDFLDGMFARPEDLQHGFAGMVQILVLMAVYGFVLSKAGELISNGSELLLLVPSIAGAVGSIVLPVCAVLLLRRCHAMTSSLVAATDVWRLACIHLGQVLGAVPDGAIILFSGLGPNAQDTLKVGVGSLAGSTVMLLTGASRWGLPVLLSCRSMSSRAGVCCAVPWLLGIVAGRVNLDAAGEGAYKSRVRLADDGGWWRWRALTTTGVNCHASVKSTGLLMIVSRYEGVSSASTGGATAPALMSGR
jgi:hypothetical protein